jgi:preprotein translocase subunit SecA
MIQNDYFYGSGELTKKKLEELIEIIEEEKQLNLEDEAYVNNLSKRQNKIMNKIIINGGSVSSDIFEKQYRKALDTIVIAFNEDQNISKRTKRAKEQYENLVLKIEDISPQQLEEAMRIELENAVESISWRYDELQYNDFPTEYLVDRICDFLLKEIEEKIRRSLINFKDSLKCIGIMIGGSIRIQDYPIFTENKFIFKLKNSFGWYIKSQIDFNRVAREFIKENENLIEEDTSGIKRLFCKKILGLIPKKKNYEAFQKNLRQVIHNERQKLRNFFENDFIKKIINKSIFAPKYYLPVIRMKILYARHDYHFFLPFSHYLSKIKGLDRSEIVKVSERFGSVMEKMNSPSKFNISDKHIKSYTSSDINTWVIFFKQVPTYKIDKDLEDELLSVICQNVKMIFNYYPNATQILSLIIFLTKNKHLGRICEIKTGEGKSLIIAMLASYLSLRKDKKVHIITSSPVLAKRDSLDFERFFQCLNLKNENNTSGSKYSYDSEIMYGTNSSFQADILRTEYKGQDKHKDIKFEIVIVDEVDNMFIDDFSKSTYLAESKQGMDKLLFIFLQMWEEFLKIEGNFINKKQAEIRSDTNKEYKFYAERFEMTNQLVKVTLRNLEENKKLSFLNIPDYLKVYIQTNLETWAMNLIKAKYDMEENKDYSTKGGRVCPVDYTNTGVTQRNSQYGEGLQQFLQIKHNLELTEHHLITNFFSNIGQFTRYMDCDGENCIFALTGTLGENHKSKEILQDIYKVDLVDIPTNKPRQFEEPQILICNNTHQQKVKLIDTLQEYKSRTVLVIFETIKQVDEFKKELQGKDLSKQIYPYTDSEDSASNNFISTNIFQSGDIILSTNLSGRGCDIKISQDVETRGGLHVILTFVPESSRAEKQAFGRAARKGQKGSGEFILNLEYENLKIPQTMLYTNFIVNERERNSTREEILKKMGPKLPQEILEIILNPTIKLFELRNLREDKKIDETKKEIESIKIKDGLL